MLLIKRVVWVTDESTFVVKLAYLHFFITSNSLTFTSCCNKQIFLALVTGMLLRSSSSRSRLRFSSPPSPRRGSSTYKPNVLSKDPYIPIYAGLTTLLTLGILTIYKNYKLTNEMLREEVLVRNDIISALHENYHQAVENKDMSTLIAPTLINLCWGAASTYNRHDFTGGVGGATMRYSPEKDFVSNRGLQRAISFLEPIKSQHPLISYSDLWTLAAVVAIESLGGPVVPWVSGRVDEDGPKEGVDEARCPVADSGSIENDIDHIKVLFGRIGGLAFKHIVALFGVHGVGHCHEDASGYKGSWTRDVTTFSNQYFRVLLNEKWKLTTGKNVRVAQWTLLIRY